MGRRAGESRGIKDTRLGSVRKPRGWDETRKNGEGFQGLITTYSERRRRSCNGSQTHLTASSRTWRSQEEVQGTN